jgi:pSer/pThr/pTyr-binding forkhead associated (FHA) protein
MELLGKENSKKALHILKFLTKNKLSIGRGLNVDMRIPEISVSRNHASIHYSNGEFFIEDTNSKYGSLVLIQKDFAVGNYG